MSTLAKIDTTTHNNVGSVKTSRPGFSENSEVSVDLGYTGSTAQDAIRTQYDAGTVGTWMIVAPTSAGGISRSWSFSGYVSSCGTPKFDKEGNATMSFKVQPTGQLTVLSTGVVGLTTPFLSITDQGATALTLSPAAASATYGYQVTTDLADTGVKVTATDATSGEVIYIDNTLVTTGAASGAITLGTSAGSIIMISVVVFKTACVPKVYWIEVTHGYV
jgi:hypothetical protein